MPKFLSAVALSLLLISPLQAQAGLTLEWQEDTAVNAQLPTPIRLYKGAGRLPNGSPVKAHYSITELASDQVQLTAAMSETGFRKPSELAAANPERVFVCINGGFFTQTGSVSLLIREGEILARNIHALQRSNRTYYPTRGAFGVDKQRQGSIDWVYHLEQTVYRYPRVSANSLSAAPLPQPSKTYPYKGTIWNKEHAVGGGPILIRNGVRVDNLGHELFPKDIVASVAPRTAIGLTDDNRLIMLVVDGRQPEFSVGVSLEQLTDLLLQLGSVDAMNLDGGGSSVMLVRGEVVNRPSDGRERAVKTALMITERAAIK
ncbi:hypothetical protein HMF8227_02648 [Saliniradius amylolyticus]|uniref:Phosphodiester glycosidase domain-containing protein n=1 Tax=Saliniradius amylolyticus TaxID=2183582 RepID=A0A2S2E790_9ALTE|nr:phosphodiester glycosidase family protein [Saliniradius amylolyticus]AWL13100.1 hypothetical protein HMF8227_02648 [Saliniradius amylolyticus]